MHIATLLTATGRDADAIASINEEIRKVGYSDRGFLVPPVTAAEVREEMDTRSANYILYMLDGTAAGFVKYSRRSLAGYQRIDWYDVPLDLSSSVHIEKVAVRDVLRGHGIGRALYAEVSRRNPGRPLHTYVVMSPCRNQASMAFHRALGFTPRARAPYEITPGEWMLEELIVLDDPERLRASSCFPDKRLGER